jgi:hypothetical protein
MSTWRPQVEPAPEPTVGDFIGLPPMAPPAPEFAFADTAEALTEPGMNETMPEATHDFRPGDNEPPPGERPIEDFDPDESPDNSDEATARLNAQRQRVYDGQRQRAGFKARADELSTGFIVPGSVKYESRIQIVDAFRYPGNLANAPSWIDRNWVAATSTRSADR